MGTKHDEITARFASKIEMKPIGWTKPYERNARTHSADQIAQIVASILENGWTNPMLVQADGTIIAGHGRRKAALDIGLEEVPVIILDHLTKTQAELLVLADNKIALNAGWDEEMLEAELQRMEAAGMDLSLTGFSGDELDEYLLDEPLEEEKPQPEPEKSVFEEVTFSLHKKQAAKLRAALRSAKNAGGFTDGLNGDNDGNALARIAHYYLEANREGPDFIEDPALPRSKKKPAAKKPAGKAGKRKT